MSPDDVSSRPSRDEATGTRVLQRVEAIPGRPHVPGGLIFALVCVLIIGVVAHWSVRHLRADATWVEHTREVIGCLAAVLSATSDLQTQVRTFVVTGEESLVRELPGVLQHFDPTLDRIDRLVSDNPEQRRRAELLRQALAAQLAFEQRLIAIRREQGFDAARGMVAGLDGRQLHDRVRGAVSEMRRTEEALLDLRESRAVRSAALADAVIVSGSVFGFGLVGIALAAIRRDSLARAHAEAARRETERKMIATHDELGREKARLEFIFEAAPIGISYAYTDASGRRTRLVNEAHLRICGMSRADFDRPENFVRVTHPDDRPAQARLAADLESGKIDRYSVDKRYVRPDGGVLWVLLTFERRRHGDGSYEDLSVVVDITNRKRAEAELENFFAVSLDFLTIAGSDGYFKRVNPTVTDILGWTVEEFLSRPYLEYVHPDDREATLREVERQLVRGEKTLHFENRYLHKDGSWRLLSWRSVPHADGMMYGAAQDITDSRRAELEIRRLNADLQERATEVEAANKELEAFSYSVSHDLRAPLRHIQGYIAMLVRDTSGQLSEKAQRYLGTIADAAREMGELIDNLLTFSRMGRIELRFERVDLNEIVDEVRSDLEPVMRDRSIVWRVDRLPVVRGDRSMLKQVFVNLLDNAVKYTRPRNPATIEVGSGGPENGRAVLFVRDNGVGFDLKYADKLFAVFQRLHRPDEFEGTGVGLANVQRIVRRHGGRVWADAKVDAGATFFLTLERVADTGDEPKPTP